MAVQQWITPLKGLDSLTRTEAPMPVAGKGEVLVEIRAVSLNYRDVEGQSLAERNMNIQDPNEFLCSDQWRV
jgi:NADPH:quinone reductase-like Zn-dependent oxidoreductase